MPLQRTFPVCVIALLLLAGCGHRNDDLPAAETVASREDSVRRLDGSLLAADDVNRIVSDLMSDRDISGLALAILNENDIVFLKGFGSRAPDRPMTTTTALSGASFSKAIFACLVMQLVNEGHLELDRPLSEYLANPLPSYEHYQDLAGDDRWRAFTPRILLSHTSGLPNWRWLNPDRKLDIQFEPGARYSYSGEGIDLLQRAVEEITEQTLDELMQERIFAPLGMRRTRMTWDPMFEADYAVGFHTASDRRVLREWESASAAGSVTTTIADMAIFLQAVLQGRMPAAPAKDEMLSPQIRIRSPNQFPTGSAEVTDRDDDIRLSYGLGWGLFWSPHGQAFFKEGHDDGWEHYMVAFVDSGTALIVMTNSSNGESAFRQLLSQLIGDDYTPSVWNRYDE
jgi:CubicO group peptidase (beta-lactamase class C family)